MNTKSVVIGVIVVAVLAVGGFLVFHKSDDKTASTTTSSSSGSTAGSANAPTAGAVIKTATSSSMGQYLTDGADKPLYTYGADTSGKSNCNGSCLYTWPVYAPGSTTNLPANVTVIKRDDGSSQYAYKGMPLYYFTSDSANNPTGDGVSNFHLAKP